MRFSDINIWLAIYNLNCQLNKNLIEYIMAYIRTQPSANDFAPKIDIKSKFYAPKQQFTADPSSNLFLK